MTQTTSNTDDRVTKPVQQLRITSRNLQTCAQFEPNATKAALIGAAAASVTAVQARLEADLVAYGLTASRPAAVPDFAPIEVGELRIERISRAAFIGANLIHLTAIEFDLLCVLATDPTRVFTKPELYREVYNHELPSKQRKRTLDSHACASPCVLAS